MPEIVRIALKAILGFCIGWILGRLVQTNRRRREVKTLKAALADAQKTHCPNCDRFEETEAPYEGFSGGTMGRLPAEYCSECYGLVGFPHWPRCTRRGIVTASDMPGGPHAL
jgi:hypothetical protein